MRQKQEMTSSNVDLKYYNTAEARPGDQHGFGFGNVRTGQVSTRKMTFLTRSSSAGPEDRAGLNPDVLGRQSPYDRSASARASPMPILAPIGGEHKSILKVDNDMQQGGGGSK